MQLRQHVSNDFLDVFSEGIKLYLEGKWLEANGGDFNYYNSIKDYAKNIVFLDLVTYSIEKYDRPA
jgi:hypothetical protein